ncbi:hypothetical protein V1477_021096 [Vespula maculifrons]|uniref:Uncharacterized protein n=1 Tax=Vespula maculifrons TaxID=7453 RepID=A0ABD2AH49_VESMC
MSLSMNCNKKLKILKNNWMLLMPIISPIMLSLLSQQVIEGACSVAKVSAYSDCGVWGMNTSYQRTSGKIVGHSFGGCGTGNTPGSALLYIFSTFIHHTSQRAIFIAKDPNLAISEFIFIWHLLFFRTSDDTSHVDSRNVRPSTRLREDVLFEIEPSQILRMVFESIWRERHLIIWSRWAVETEDRFKKHFEDVSSHCSLINILEMPVSSMNILIFRNKCCLLELLSPLTCSPYL